MKKIILAAVVAAVASMAVASFASADVARYQTQTMTITVVQPENAVSQWTNVWTHTYNVTLNPCDGSFSGIGSVSGTLNGSLNTETITGRLVGNTVSFTATRYDGFVYSLSNAPLDNATVTLGPRSRCPRGSSRPRSARRRPSRRRTTRTTATTSRRRAAAPTRPTRASGCPFTDGSPLARLFFGGGLRAAPARSGPRARGDRPARDLTRPACRVPRGTGHRYRVFADAPGKIRTCDLCLRRAALYPLSYGRRGRGQCSRAGRPVDLELGVVRHLDPDVGEREAGDGARDAADAAVPRGGSRRLPGAAPSTSSTRSARFAWPR